MGLAWGNKGSWLSSQVFREHHLQGVTLIWGSCDMQRDQSHFTMAPWYTAEHSSPRLYCQFVTTAPLRELLASALVPTAHCVRNLEMCCQTVGSGNARLREAGAVQCLETDYLDNSSFYVLEKV